MKNILLLNNLLWMFLLISCDRDFLNKKPNQAHVVPTTLSDFEAILDDDLQMNGSGNSGRGPVPGLGEAASDDYYLTDASFSTILIKQTQNYYTWAQDVYDGYPPYDWQNPYECVFSSNIVLDGLQKIKREPVNQSQFDRVKGAALFYRSHAFYQLAQIYCLPYKKEEAGSLQGLPLRLSSDLDEHLTRSTLEDTYTQVISDLNISLKLLPTEPAVNTRPSKSAVYGLLSRIHLSMQQYPQAKLYADSCLSIKSSLSDYNALNKEAAFPFAGGAYNHPEVFFACNMILNPVNMPFRSTFALVDTVLYNMYDDNDLRKQVFFTKNGAGHSFKGSYEGNTFLFAGMATDEIYLIRAECLMRTGQIKEGFVDLNHLLQHRQKRPYIPLQADNISQKEALSIVLSERRKELLFRGLRWVDLRRLNQEGFDIALKRVVDNQEYYLYPDDKKYTYPIPPEVMGFHPDWTQNER